MKTRLLLSVLSVAVLGPFAAAQAPEGGRIVCDETCRIEYQETPQLPQAPGYAVVSPAGRSTVEMITQAPRLETLDKKTIAVVGVSFMTGVTHPEIKKLILEHYPSARVVLLDEIGIAGVYPPPGVTRSRKEDFQAKLKSLHVDAVISGNGGCGLCTPKEAGSCIAAEYLGIPSVMIAGPGFAEQARYTALNNGVPVLRIARYPGAFASHSEQELIRNTREVLWPQIVEGLTRPLTVDEIQAGTRASKGDIRDDAFYGTLPEIDDYFREMNWTDGLPFVPPTFDEVSRFVELSHLDWNETVGVLPPAHRETKVWHVAVNAVMAGCKPEYLPVCIAIAKGLGAPEFRRTLSSTHAWMPYCWISGPVAEQLGISSGQGEINAAANVALGRFLNLALMNLCGYYVGQNRMGTFGYPMPWCLVEDVEACRRIGWKPWHVRAGFREDESTVTVASALLWGNNMAPSTTDPEKMMELMAWDITERCQFALGSGKQFVPRTVLMTEPVAKILSERYKTPEQLENALIKMARRPLKERAFANYYANPGGTKDGGQHSFGQYQGWLRRSEGAAATPTAPWVDSPDAEQMTIPVMQKGSTDFLITGDEARNKVQIMPGGGHATVKIQPIR